MVAKLIIFIASQFPFDFITPKGKGCQGSKAIEAFIFEYKNTRSDFKYCDYREK